MESTLTNRLHRQSARAPQASRYCRFVPGVLSVSQPRIGFHRQHTLWTSLRDSDSLSSFRLGLPRTYTPGW